MAWSDIVSLTVQRLAEYQAGDADPTPTFSQNTLYNRVGKSFKRMLDKIAAHDPDKVTTLASFQYATGLESITLPAAIKYRDVFSLERLVASTTDSNYEPIYNIGAWAEQQARIESQWLVAVDIPTQTTYAYRIEGGTLLYVYPKPSQDLTLRARYFAATADLTPADAASFPTFIPDEYYDLIALMTARNLRAETSSVPKELQEDYDERWQEYVAWAGGRPKRTQLRFVHERD